jgi:glutaminyl-tRNA synthetase
MDTPDARQTSFLAEIIAADVAAGRNGGRVATRFPPEPNGYPHIGHAQSICLNFGLAARFGGTCNLRFDDTNPETESEEFARALEDAVRWLGFEPAAVRYASDDFETLYGWAQDLVRRGLAYVDSQSGDAIRAGRGTVTEPGTPSPFRGRPAAECLRLLDEMRRGLHPDGSHVLRARIDTEHGPMAHPNMKLRDPVMYRIRRDAHHYRRGTDWAIYPLYDWAHGQVDAIEGITHSICTLEFDVNRPLYDWYLDALGVPSEAAPVRPRQHEFARFNLEGTITSKRKLRQLVEEGHVEGWDDPRMPTVAGLRRRGVPAHALRRFFDDVGVTRVNGRVDLAQFEHAIRDSLNAEAPRRMAVARPVPLMLTNLDAPRPLPGAPLWPHDVAPPPDALLARDLVLTRDLWVEADDVALEPPKGWKRLAPGRAVRLRHGPVVRCTAVETDASGRVTAVRAEIDDEAASGGVIHWVSAEHGVPARLRLVGPLFDHPAPDELDDFREALTPGSLEVAEGFVEPGLAPGERVQFERTGYFWADPVDSASDALVFNRIVALRDSWAKKTDAPAPPRAEPKAPAPTVGPRDPASALSDAQRSRYDALVERGVGAEEAAVLAADADLEALFDAVAAAGAPVRDAAVLLVHDLRPARGERAADDDRATPGSLAALLALMAEGTLTRSGAREVLSVLVAEGGDARAIAETRGLAVVDDDASLGSAIDAVLTAHPDEVARYRSGENRLVGFFTGQAMRALGKGADPKRVQAVLAERLAQGA